MTYQIYKNKITFDIHCQLLSFEHMASLIWILNGLKIWVMLGVKTQIGGLFELL
jgi:hypothetical protein